MKLSEAIADEAALAQDDEDGGYLSAETLRLWQAEAERLEQNQAPLLSGEKP